jgi:hypothetical protein
MADAVASIVSARFFVASLGEAASPPWWRTEVMSAASMRIMARLFPRTYIAASLETAGRAAAIEHDARIGRIGAYHLFRLPTAEEMVILEWLRRPEAGVLLSALAEISSREERLSRLGEVAGEDTAAATQGPVQCGVVTDLQRGVALQRICGAYRAGFTAGKPVYPYLLERPH